MSLNVDFRKTPPETRPMFPAAKVEVCGAHYLPPSSTKCPEFYDRLAARHE